MRIIPFQRKSIAVIALALLPVLPATAEPMLRLTPQGPTAFSVGAVGAQVTFDVQIAGLTSGTNVVSSYDFGIVYDPAIMILASFGGFTTRLGDPSAADASGPTQVYNQNHLDQTNDPLAPVPVVATDCGATGYFQTCNSQWDYRAEHPDLGAYKGDVLGTPIITPAGIINEGSLRFYQASYLFEADLLIRQNPTANDTLTLFSLTFDVITSAPGSTQILSVDDRFYEGFVQDSGPWSMDVKLNDDTARYLPLQGSSVSVSAVPVPATWALLLLGLVAAARGARRQRPATTDA